MSKMLCPACGLLIDVRSRWDPNERLLHVHIEWDGHDCRPWLSRFFNPDSQHGPPFGR